MAERMRQDAVIRKLEIIGEAVKQLSDETKQRRPEISWKHAAKQLGVSLNRLNELVLGKRGVTADTALRLARFLKTSPQLWMRLQADWDLQQALLREGRKAS